MPPDLELTDSGLLPPCPASPNCVSSDAAPTDGRHHIAPLRIQGEPEAYWQRLVAHLERDPAITIIARREGFLHVEARTRIFRFVDDVLFHLRPEKGEIAVRSASRLGYSDLGKNRKRLEALRQELAG